MAGVRAARLVRPRCAPSTDSLHTTTTFSSEYLVTHNLATCAHSLTHNLLLTTYFYYSLSYSLTTVEVRALRQGVARYSARCAHVQGSKCWPKLTRTPRGLRLYVRTARTSLSRTEPT